MKGPIVAKTYSDHDQHPLPFLDIPAAMILCRVPFEKLYPIQLAYVPLKGGLARLHFIDQFRGKVADVETLDIGKGSAIEFGNTIPESPRPIEPKLKGDGNSDEHSSKEA